MCNTFHRAKPRAPGPGNVRVVSEDAFRVHVLSEAGSEPARIHPQLFSWMVFGTMEVRLSFTKLSNCWVGASFLGPKIGAVSELHTLDCSALEKLTAFENVAELAAGCEGLTMGAWGWT